MIKEIFKRTEEFNKGKDPKDRITEEEYLQMVLEVYDTRIKSIAIQTKMINGYLKEQEQGQ